VTVVEGIDGVVAGGLAGAAGLLMVAGAAKVVDPTRTVVALREMGWGVPLAAVRAGAALETLLGAATLVLGGRPWGLLVAVSYLGFALFVMAALRAGTPVGSCGCLGQADTAPRPGHVVVDAVFAAAAVGAAAADAPALLDASWVAWPTAAVVALVAYGLLTGAPAGRDRATRP
jgi:hypothetical protein